MATFRHNAQAAASACRLPREQTRPAAILSARPRGRFQNAVLALYCQGRYRRAMRPVDRHPLLDNTGVDSVERVHDLHTPASAPVVVPEWVAYNAQGICRHGRRQAARDG
jgi:hypothetical protein